MPTPITFGAMAARAFGFTSGNGRGEDLYDSPGTYTWFCPVLVDSVSVVAVGGGSSGAANIAGAGAGLGYKNNYAVTATTGYTVVVGSGGAQPPLVADPRNPGGDSYFDSLATVSGEGGNASTGGGFTGDGGGSGGTPSFGGGGAGGYSGNGGDFGSAGSGGGGGGGNNAAFPAGGGGGVGVYGEGSNGIAGVNPRDGGGGGSSGDAGQNGTASLGGAGGDFGGGGGTGAGGLFLGGAGGGGAVRIVYPGDARQFPSTDVGTP